MSDEDKEFDLFEPRKFDAEPTPEPPPFKRVYRVELVIYQIDIDADGEEDSVDVLEEEILNQYNTESEARRRFDNALHGEDDE